MKIKSFIAGLILMGVLIATPVSAQVNSAVGSLGFWRLLSNAISPIISSMKVGVGTTTPWAKFAVTGTSGQTNPLFEIANSSNVPRFTITSSGVAVLGTTTAGTLNVTSAGIIYAASGASAVTSVGLTDSNSTITIGNTPITTSGNITATLNLAKVNIWTGLQSFFGNASSTGFSANYASIGGTATTTLTTDGRLGLGTTTPSEKLTVAGGILGTESAIATSTSISVNLSNSNQTLIQTGTAATTITLTNLLAGQSKRVIVCNPNASAGAITWASTPANSLLWTGETAPTQTTTANKCDIYTFMVTQATSTSASTVRVLGGYIQNF